MARRRRGAAGLVWVGLGVGCVVAAGGGCAGSGGTAAGDARRARTGAASFGAACEPIVIGESFTIESRVMGEPRRVNVFTPTVYGEAIAGALPVLVMLDGGVNEDFLHVAGLVQVMVSNGTMRPMRLVGIPNPSTAARRRDLTGPTTNPSDRKADAGAGLGESERFRRFVVGEVMPAVRGRYATADEGGAIVGESLAGLFVVETLLIEPRAFGTYIAIDPSLWWSSEALVNGAAERVELMARRSEFTPLWGVKVFVATSGDSGLGEAAGRLERAFTECGVATGVRFVRVEMPGEGHATIYHPAAMRAFGEVLGVEVAR